MSLFPAYSVGDSASSKCNEQEIGEGDAVDTEKLWLANPSFSVEVSQIPLPGEAKEQTVIPEVSTAKRRSELPGHRKERKASSHKKLKRYHKELRKKNEEPEIGILGQNTVFYEDKTCEKGNLWVPTLSRPAIPLYRVYHRSLMSWSNVKKVSKKRKHLDRYFMLFHKLNRHLDESNPSVAAENSITAANEKRLNIKVVMITSKVTVTGTKYI